MNRTGVDGGTMMCKYVVNSKDDSECGNESNHGLTCFIVSGKGLESYRLVSVSLRSIGCPDDRFGHFRCLDMPPKAPSGNRKVDLAMDRS